MKKFRTWKGIVFSTLFNKLLLIMKLSSCLILLFGLNVYASVYSQNTKLNIQAQDITIQELLKIIEGQSNFRFFYSNDIRNLNETISLSAQNETIDDILSEVFSNGTISYKVLENNMVVISPFNLAQGIKISGTVTDASTGEPLPGVYVRIEGTQSGAITDADGNYNVEVIDNNSVLIFSFVGYNTENISVAGKTEINVSMIADIKALEEVVVIGYGAVKKGDLTGSVGSVSSDDFKMQPIVQVSDVLQGRSSGVIATSTSGRVGSTPRIRVRGTSSINTGNSPLWVVDGVIDGTIVNPDDIESIEILKDASSTAIYGSRGANGVILVTTRHGKEGKTQITASSNISYSNIAKKWDLMNAYEYAMAYNDIMGANTFNEDELATYKNGTKGIDWVDLMTQRGVLQDYRIGISGGDQKTKFSVSGNYINQTGTIITSQYERYNFKANFDTKLTSWLKMFSDISLTKDSYHNQGDMDDFRTILEYSPTMELMDEDGVCYEDTYNTIHSNPWADKQYVDKDSKAHTANTLINFTANILDGLTFSVLGNILYNQNERYTFGSEKRYSGADSYITNSESRTIKWQTTENLTYQKTFGEHHLTLTGVFEAMKSETPSLSIEGNSLLSEKVYYWDIGNAETTSCDNGYSDESMSSFFARGSYNYKGRYYVTGTIRADGSSKFQGDNKWGYFPSGALAWDIAKENFMKNQHIFQQLKLRTSYGLTGNQGIDPYETLGLLERLEYVYATQTTLYPGYWQSSFATPDLTWEKTHQLDIGFDMSMLDQRLNVSIDWYRKETKDLLFEKTIPYYNGGGTYWTNQGEIRNKGFEISIDADILGNSSEFKWQSMLNASFNKSEIIDLAGEEYIIPDESRGDLMSPSFIMKPGHQIGTFYLYDYAGIDDEGCNLYRNTDGSTSTSASDKFLTGNSIPEWTFGWNNNFRWRNWEANVLFRSDLGYYKLNVTKFSLTSMVGASRFIRLREAYSKSWDKVSNKADALYPSLTNGSVDYEGASTQWLEKANFLRCQNITIAYHIPQKIVKVGEAVVSVSTQNLFTITGYDGIDPETVSEDDNDQQSGYDCGSYPLARTFTFGVKLNF